MVKVLVIGAPPLTLSRHCANAFKQEGHETKYINYRFLYCHEFKITNKLLSKYLISVCSHFKPDLVFVVKGDSLLPGTVESMKKMGAYTMNWVIYEPTEKDYPVKITNFHEYDHAISFDKAYLSVIKQLGAPKADFLPIGADETLFKEIIPLQKRNYICDASFIGTFWPEREKLFLKIADKELKIYGPHWKKKLAKDSLLQGKIQKKVLNGTKMCKYFNLSKINLNQTHQQAIDGGINLRIPEVLATRSFLLTNNLKGLDELFTPDKELVVYKDTADFVKKVEYYLIHPAERDAIAEAGYQRLLKEHTLRHRVRTILKLAGLVH